MRELSALILDYGEVLSRPQRADCVAAMAGRLGVAVEAFRDAYWRHRRPYDAGLPAAEYWGRVLETLGHGAPAADRAATLDWLVATDVASWTAYREETWALARAFRAGDSVHIPAPTIHQIEAVVDSDVLEASTPELDDLVRIKDRYGRK